MMTVLMLFFDETDKVVYIYQFKSKENFKEGCDFKKDWASLFSNCDKKITVIKKLLILNLLPKIQE
jgi:hypothetical protein